MFSLECLSKLFEQARNGNAQARDQLVLDNTGLVWSVVKKYRGRGYEQEDLFQIGCIGLMKAIDRFDQTFGVCFSTYAVPMIIGEVRRYLRDNNSIRVSRSLRDTAYKALQAKERLEEDRYRKLDHLLRQQQALRKEASKSAAGHYLRKLFGETT